jgi:DNA end-binding protein Ku
VNAEMVEIAETIIDRMSGKWEPAKFQDRYQDALRELIAAKSKGFKPKASPVTEPQSNVVDLMAVLKRSLTQAAKSGVPVAAKSRKKPAKAKAPSKQASMLLPVAGGRAGKPAAATAAQRKPAGRKRA